MVLKPNHYSPSISQNPSKDLNKYPEAISLREFTEGENQYSKGVEKKLLV